MSELPRTAQQAEYNDAKRVTQIGTLWDFILTMGKISIGLLANSAALVAEGVHSAADLLFDLVVLLGMKFARKRPDADHPYGHGKFEGLASILLAVILLAVAFGIVSDAMNRIHDDRLTAPGGLAFWAALFSIVVKELLFQYTIRVGKRLKSNIIVANAWHHRADSISSLAALIGIGGALMGYPIFDPIAAIAVGFFVSKVAFEIGGTAIKELTDSSESIDTETWEQIKTIIESHPQIESAHDLRARRMGPEILADVHIEVESFLSVSEGHQIAASVRAAVLAQISAITDVIVHVDVEHDWHGADGDNTIPLDATRTELLEAAVELIAHLNPVVAVRHVTPHYTSEGIIVELVLESTGAYPFEQVHQAAMEASKLLYNSKMGVLEVRAQLYLLTVG